MLVYACIYGYIKEKRIGFSTLFLFYIILPFYFTLIIFIFYYTLTYLITASNKVLSVPVFF